ncbi:MAG: PAS domain-containing protein [Rhodospirillales bacterium]|nr:PAS domain-containing protein [Rhodospirillales bacterium]
MLAGVTSAPAAPSEDGVHPMLECLGVAAFVIDILGDGWLRFAAANHRFLEAVGRERVVGLSPAAVLAPELGGELEARCRGCLETAAAATWDVEMRGDAGMRCWRLVLAPVAETDRDPARVFATMTDVTGLVHERRQLRDREQAVRAAVDAIDQGVAVWDTSERLIHCNAVYARHHPQIAGRLVPGAGYRALLWEDAAAGCQPRADGRRIRTSVHCAPDGGLVTVSTDVTAATAMRSAAERSSAAFSALFGAMDEAGLWVTASGRVAALNSAAADWLCATPESVIGRPLMSVLDADTAARIASQLDMVIAGGKAEPIPCSRDGRSLVIRARPITGADGRATGAVLSVRDSSALEAATARANDCEQALARAMRIASLGEMAGGLVHEVSQPIAAVVNYCRGCINLLRSSDGGDVTAVVDALEEACREAERASAIMQNITGMIRRSPGSKSEVDINAAVRGVCDRLQKEARKRRVALNLDLAEDLPRPSGNAIEVEQVLTNLVKNALEAAAATTEGERRATVRTAAGADAAVEVIVSDTGAGFAGQDAAQAFAPFYTTKPGGIGMGLSICRAIVEGHGGRIFAGNHEHGGGVVRVTLPLDTS